MDQEEAEETARQMFTYKWVTEWLNSVASIILLNEGQHVWVGTHKAGRLYISSNWEDMFDHMVEDGIDLRAVAVKRINGR